MRAVRRRSVRGSRSVPAAVVVAVVLASAAAQASRGPWTFRAVDADAIVRTARVNISTSGAQANGATSAAVLSANGRYVAFLSNATDLARGDHNRIRDVFVRDLRTRTTTRESVSTTGAGSDGPSEKPSISADGELLAFPSAATNLVSDDRNGSQ